MAISDLPGYIQGYKFQNTASTYNSVDGYFIDQAGYSDFPASRLEITEGTPNFVTVNATTGLELNNTVQGFFNSPIKWGGSAIFVMGGPGTFGTNGFLLPFIHGAAAGVTSNGLMYINRSGTHNHTVLLPGGITSANRARDDAIYAHAMSIDQENRNSAVMSADGTIATGGTVADNDLGLAMVATTEDGIYGSRDRFGNLNGTKGNTTATGNTMIICEAHFFSGVLTAGDTTAVETELTALEAIYG